VRRIRRSARRHVGRFGSRNLGGGTLRLRGRTIAPACHRSAASQTLFPFTGHPPIPLDGSRRDGPHAGFLGARQGAATIPPLAR